MRPFTQSAYVLTQEVVTLDELETALAAFEQIDTLEPAAHWAGGGEGVVIRGAHRNMRVTVDIVAAPFVDDLVASEDALLQAVWQAGGLGPDVANLSLTQARKQCWLWPIAGAALEAHDSFVRFRVSWLSDDGQALEDSGDRNPIEELTFLTLAVAGVLALKEKAICYFNPNGESLRSGEFVHAALAHHGETGEVPLDVWCNLGLERREDDVIRMRSAGMRQLELPEVAAEFKEGSQVFESVDAFLRDVCAYLLVAGDVIEDGHAVDGPGGDWRAKKTSAGLIFTPVRPPVDD